MDAADNLLQNKLTPQKLTPRKTTFLACPSHSRGRGRGQCERSTEANRALQMLPPSRPAPPPPSPTPRREYHRTHDENLREGGGELNDEEPEDPASKIWAKIRRYSSGFGSHRRRSSSTSTANSVTASISLPFSANCATDSRALRRKKTAVDRGSTQLMPRQRLVGMSSKTSLTDRTNLSMCDEAMYNSQRRSSKTHGKGRRGSGRWSIGNWWV